MSRRGEPAGPRDAVDLVVEGWRGARPDLDVTPTGIAVRLARVRAILERESDAVFARHGISSAVFSAVAAVSRLGGDDGVTQAGLARALRLTSGTVSVRVDRLVADGLAVRRQDPGDRRGTLVALTARGREVFERAAPDHLLTQRRLLASLGPEEQRTLADLLRTLLIDLEGAAGPEDDPGRRLGAVIAPAHESEAMRAAVGLPERPGCLVRSVEPDGPAHRAGLAPGDLLVAVDADPVSSLSALARALAAPGPHTVHRVRGESAGVVRVELAAP
jgi:DNA-binding MarR family transcriptional regulator